MKAIGIIGIVLIVALVVIFCLCFYRVITDAIFGVKVIEPRRDDQDPPVKKS